MIADLDQYYTRSDIAKQCVRYLARAIEYMPDRNTLFYLEPSAGSGAFYDLLPSERRMGLDIAPKRAEILKQDFLTWKPSGLPRAEHVAVIGNPPFGRKGNTAIDFIRKANTFAETIAFILPASFQKFSSQKQLPNELKLIETTLLPQNSFHRPDGTLYEINTVFQVWSSNKAFETDIRTRTPPASSHPDFKMWQYNNTSQAMSVFDNQFDFAVPCQGFQNYKRRETDKTRCEKHKQWILFQSDDPDVRQRLWDIDYAKLAASSTLVIPGFRKHDIVSAYLLSLSET